MWIWQQPDWPNFNWQEEKLAPRLRKIRKLEGILQAKSDISGDRSERILNILTQNILASAGLEGEVDYQIITQEPIQNALSKRLGINHYSTKTSDPLAEGLAAIQMEVYQNSNHELGLNRFFRWHVNLYSDLSVTSGIRAGAINVGKLRDEKSEQLMSDPIDTQALVFEAPPKAILRTEIEQFLNWFKVSQHDESIDPILRTCLAHLWFMTLHPFEEGNGILGRFLIDLALMQSNNKSLELYSFSAAMLDNKIDYTEMLEYTQRNGMDVTHWMHWFVVTLEQAIQTAIDSIKVISPASNFRSTRKELPAVVLNKHQIKVLHLLATDVERFEHGISASQYQKITRVSKATATRHLADLLTKKCLQKLPGGGRSTRYEIRY